MTDSATTVTVLQDLAIIEATGADTASFLHGQLSNDIIGLSDQNACLAAYCTPKGRMLASMVVWKTAGENETVYRMLIKRDIAAAIVKRLSMFVLRAKVKLALSASPVFGVTLNASAPSLPQAMSPILKTLPDLQPYQITNTAQGTLIGAPRVREACARYWFIPENAEATIENADLALQPRRAALWAADDIGAGLPWIELANQEMFIPQTLNLELIGGVSFTKGCYPGQEVVARSHYRGTVKRRMTRAVTIDQQPDAQTLAGQDTFDANAPESAVGRVVNAVNAEGKTHLLIEVQLSDIGSADLRLQSPQGPSLSLLELPYNIDPPKD